MQKKARTCVPAQTQCGLGDSFDPSALLTLAQSRREKKKKNRKTIWLPKSKVRVTWRPQREFLAQVEALVATERGLMDGLLAGSLTDLFWW